MAFDEQLAERIRKGLSRKKHIEEKNVRSKACRTLSRSENGFSRPRSLFGGCRRSEFIWFEK